MLFSLVSVINHSLYIAILSHKLLTSGSLISHNALIIIVILTVTVI